MDPMVAIAAVLSALHLLALGIGLPAVFLRGRALKGALDSESLGRALAADSAWGLAALLWLGTGLLRAFGGFEKGTAYYLHNALFHAKLGLFLIIVVLEIYPMITMMRWRIARVKGEFPDTSPARTLYVINHVQLAIVVVMVFIASFMARGFGSF